MNLPGLWSLFALLFHNASCSFFAGVKDDVVSKSIDEMNPSTKEEFLELSQLLVEKLSQYEVGFDVSGPK